MGKIPILHYNPENGLLVINKPSPMPVQREVGYRQANVMNLLKQQLRLSGCLRPLHRLDLVTSGVLMLSLKKEAAQEICSLIAARKVQKTYVARVRGCFPHDETLACEADVDGKPAVTYFHAYNTHEYPAAGRSDSTVVVCKPLTGRKHQIREHLQHLGFPIVNDPQHGGLHHHDAMPSPYKDDSRGTLFHFLQESIRSGREEGKDTSELEKHAQAIQAKDVRWLGEQKVFTRGIYLHAWKYECLADDGQIRWSFEAPLPEWVVGRAMPLAANTG
eukprot:g4693.t1